MPPRLSKRLQREQEELQALGKTTVVIDQWSDEEIISTQERQRTASSSAAIGFAALLNDEDEEQGPEEESDEELSTTAKPKKGKSKKKKRKRASQPETPVQITQLQSVKSPKSKTRERETSSTSSKSGGKLKAKEDDQFEKALAELSGKFTAASLSSQSKLRELTQAQTLYSLLSVNLKNLDPEAELRRFFGSKVIASSGHAGPSTSHSSRIRSNLAKQQSTWPPPQYVTGLTMRELTPEERERKNYIDAESKEKWWTIDANSRYKGITYEYLQCVMGGDPQFFFNLLHEMPWHADTLLQLGEVFRHREEHSNASDFTSRVLFAYERCFTSAFNLTAGIHRLDFDRVENRVLYLALSRHILDLNRRGTPQTAFEFARLLFGLDPYIDPHGSLHYLDSLAIRAKQYDWLLKLWSAYEEIDSKAEAKQINVTSLPGWNWSKALALFEQGDRDSSHVRSTEALKTAILTFPAVAPLLADKLDIPIKEELRQLDCFKIVIEYNPHRDDFSTSIMHLLSHIYVSRSFSLWKPPARAEWFSKTLSSIPLSSFSSTPLSTQTRFKETFSIESALTDSIYRHVIVAAPLIADFRRLLSFFPPTVKLRMQGTIEGDPLPPTTLVTAYNDAYFGEAPTRLRNGSDLNFEGNPREIMIHGLQRAFANNAEQAREIERIQQDPQFPEIFPGGIEQFARMVREFPNDVVNLLRVFGNAQVVNVNQLDETLNPEERVMPGDLNALVEVERGDEEEDNDHGEEEAQFFPVRIIRNIAARFWGRDHDNQDEDEGSDTSYVRDSTNPAADVD